MGWALRFWLESKKGVPAKVGAAENAARRGAANRQECLFHQSERLVLEANRQECLFYQSERLVLEANRQECLFYQSERLVLAAGIKDGQHHQVRIREQPLLRLGPCRFRRARQEAKMLAARHAAEMLQANARQARNLVFGEELLARLNCDHVLSPQ